ncbi:MAG: MFS transporter [Dehalococcoidia bacterium]|nr:MFS transporter [Dehalococcoidia bacterium]MDW8119472.1 MFS transporter [Chloroflexota bacterium]
MHTTDTAGTASAPARWGRTLAIAAVVQGITVMGFSFVFPFLPLFIQDLGIADPRRAALWSGIAAGVAGIVMFLSAPIWGALSDRFGRKKNVLRGLYGGALVMVLTGVVANVYHLVAVRVLMGLLTGAVPAMMGLVASLAPRPRLGTAMGVLQAMMNLGNTVGPLLGAALVHGVGYRGAFFVAGGVLALMGVVVTFGIDERFTPPRQEDQQGVVQNIRSLLTLPGIGVVLILLFLVQFVPNVMFPVLPLFLGALAPEAKASLAGSAFALLGILGALGAYLSGVVGARVGVLRLLVGAPAVSVLGFIGLLVAQEAWHALAAIVVLGICQGIVAAQTSALLGQVVPRERMGTAYGLLQSANSLGFGLGPLVGGLVAGGLGLRPVFAVNALLALLFALVVRWKAARVVG